MRAAGWYGPYDRPVLPPPNVEELLRQYENNKRKRVEEDIAARAHTFAPLKRVRADLEKSMRIIYGGFSAAAAPSSNAAQQRNDDTTRHGCETRS